MFDYHKKYLIFLSRSFLIKTRALDFYKNCKTEKARLSVIDDYLAMLDMGGEL